MAYTPDDVNPATVGDAVLYIADGAGRVIQGIHLTQSADGGGPLTHAPGEAYSAAHHGLIGLARVSAAGGIPTGVADGQLSPLSLDGSGNLRTLVTGGFMQGQQAHDVALTANPLAVGAYASATQPAAVSADGDLTRSWADRSGRQVVAVEHPPRLAAAATHGPATRNVTASGDSEVIAAPGAGVSIHVTSVMASGYADVLTRVGVREGPAGVIRTRGTVVRGGGFRQHYSPAWKLPANTALTVNSDVAGDFDLTVVYFTAA